MTAGVGVRNEESAGSIAVGGSWRMLYTLSVRLGKGACAFVHRLNHPLL